MKSKKYFLILAGVLGYLLVGSAPLLADYGDRYILGQELPVWILGDESATEQIEFIWSKDCADCRKAFVDYVAPAYKRALRANRPISIHLFQHGTVSNIENDVCGGHARYVSLVFGYLTGVEETSLPSATNACPDRRVSEWVIETFEKKLAVDVTQNSALPVIRLNGRFLQDPKELLQQ